MKCFPIGTVRPFRAVTALFCGLILSNALFGQEWRPVTAEELQLSAPKVEKDADAEGILWEVRVENADAGNDLQTVLNHYLKVKIFNERGREAFSKMDIPFGRVQGVGFNVKIKDIAARTTKPDGTAVMLKESDIFDRDVVKGDGVKLKAKSFATPGIEPGAVVEYRWKEVRDGVSYYQRLQFAREIPVQLVRYLIKPISHPTLGMNGQSFNSSNTPFVKEKSGFYSTTHSNVPSFREEPRMPPEFSIRPWMLLYYTSEQKPEVEKYWRDHGRTVYSNHKDELKFTDEIKRAAAEAVGAETDPEKKLEKIFHYVRQKVKYMFDDALNLTSDQISKMKMNKNADEAFKRGQGTTDDINHVFAAMAAAAGFEARAVNLPRRSDIFFPKWFTDDYFLRTENIAVKVGENWRFFDPGSKYIPYGMLRWEEEGQPGLVSDPKEPVWVMTPLSEAEKSAEIRKGKFKLTEDGTLVGDVTVEYTGHIGAFHKEYNDDDTPQQREETLKNIVRGSVLGTAEVSEISIENVSDPDKPFRYIFKVRVPDYASRTGKRLFIQPNVFERNSKPMFESASRQHEIYFQYSYAEMDEIVIELPAGYSLESPDAPGRLADNSGISVNDIKISVSNDKRQLIYRRNFTFGNRGMLRFEAKNYAALKGLFEAFYKANSHALTVRQDAAAASVSK